MPKRQKGPRLWLRRREGRPAVYIIRDDTAQISTGCGPENRAGAEEALKSYLIEKRREPEAPRGSTEFMIADALAIYGKERGPEVADPQRLGFAIEALLPFWGDLSVSAIKGETCRRYVKQRKASISTARRELGALSAALNYCFREGYLLSAPPVTLPEKPAPRDRWLTEDEATRLLNAAEPWPHLRKFIMLALYTCSRGGVIRALQWIPNTESGHIDIDGGVIYRKSVMERRTKKRAPPVRIPSILMPHLPTWRDESRQYVIEWRGKPLDTRFKSSWPKARAAAGLGGDVTPHILRHTGITWLCQRGVPISEICGFAGIGVQEMERTYLHHHADFQQAAADAFGKGE